MEGWFGEKGKRSSLKLELIKLGKQIKFNKTDQESLGKQKKKNGEPVQWYNINKSLV